jgi:phage repressor protein C with HTH and peptisase S24 domain
MTARQKSVMVHKSLGHPDIKEGNVEGIRVAGDCMEPTIKDNGVVIVDTSQTDLASIQKGKIYMLYLDGRCMVKRLWWAEPGVTLVLCPDNPTHGPIVCSVDRVKLGGRVIQTWIDL